MGDKMICKKKLRMALSKPSKFEILIEKKSQTKIKYCLFSTYSVYFKILLQFSDIIKVKYQILRVLFSFPQNNKLILCDNLSPFLLHLFIEKVGDAINADGVREKVSEEDWMMSLHHQTPKPVMERSLSIYVHSKK